MNTMRWLVFGIAGAAATFGCRGKAEEKAPAKATAPEAAAVNQAPAAAVAPGPTPPTEQKPPPASNAPTIAPSALDDRSPADAGYQLAVDCALGKGWGIPASQWAEGTACVRMDVTEDEYGIVTMTFFLESARDGQRQTTPLALVGSQENLSNHAEAGVSCNTRKVQFSRQDGALAMRLSGGGRNCEGGTGDGSFTMDYRVQGATMTVAAAKVR